MARVDAAEKEASEVLHSLLSVERIEKPEQVIVVATGDNTSHSFQANATSSDISHGESELQWQTPVSMANQSLFITINDGNNHFPQTIEEQQIIWDGRTIQLNTQNAIENLYTENTVAVSSVQKKTVKSTKKCVKKKVVTKKKRKGASEAPESNDPTKIEENAIQVKERFRRGCECQDESCFRGLSAENVFKHRLNIAELTKAEHDMYLMGVTMACLANPATTVRHKERQRLRAQYVYQGRRVCLDAFLYLENCTHYQIKRIRKHVITYGVTPRVHGNHGKKPHNTFSLDIYRHATEFLKYYLDTHTGEAGIANTKQIIQLPWDITRKNLHDAYKQHGQILEPGIKLMGYSTFRHFLKEQFPNVRFCKIEPKGSQQNLQNSQMVVEQQVVQHVKQPQNQIVDSRPQEPFPKSVVTGNEVQQVLPLVVAQGNDTTNQHQQTAFLVTPVPQLLPNGNIVETQNSTNHNTSYLNYILY